MLDKASDMDVIGVVVACKRGYGVLKGWLGMVTKFYLSKNKALLVKISSVHEHLWIAIKDQHQGPASAR